MENNITIGVSKDMLVLLKDVGGFSVEKLQQLYLLACQRIIVEYSLWIFLWLVLLCVSIYLIRLGRKNTEEDCFSVEKIMVGSFGVAVGLLGVVYSVVRVVSYKITAVEFIVNMAKTVSK